MSRTITAMFDSRSEAEAARARLTGSRIDADRVRIIDKSHSERAGTGGDRDEGFWDTLKSAFMPEEDSYAYEEGMRRGGYLVCAQVEEREADEAIRILDSSSPVDFDRRREDWKSDGWQERESAARAEMAGAHSGRTGARPEHGGERAVEEEHIPVVEEELRVGKREVARGGARVRSYIKETPVHEEVSLREEHVSVERRPVDRTLARGELDRDGDLLRDRSVEMTERSEEAVVGKEARVREELVVKKTADQRTEQIDDTVRRTEVDVDKGSGGREDRSAFGSFGKGGDRTGDRTRGDARSGDRKDDREVEGTGYAPRVDKSGV